MIHQFFAVTHVEANESHPGATSLYKVEDDDGKGNPFAEKLALQGESKSPVGGRMGDSYPLLAICRYLQFFLGEGGGITSYERRIEQVNTSWWGRNTAPIVALFFDEDDARKCFECDELQPADERWRDGTRAVLDEIGPDHPVFTVCTYPGLQLMELPGFPEPRLINRGTEIALPQV